LTHSKQLTFDPRSEGKEILWKETFTVDLRDNPLKNINRITGELQGEKRQSHETPIILPGPLERDTPDVNVGRTKKPIESQTLQYSSKIVFLALIIFKSSKCLSSLFVSFLSR